MTFSVIIPVYKISENYLRMCLDSFLTQSNQDFVAYLIDDGSPDNCGKICDEYAHKYGFIIRYQKGKEHITGYKYEPWHIRYLGVDTATKVYSSGLTLEEYLGIS